MTLHQSLIRREVANKDSREPMDGPNVSVPESKARNPNRRPLPVDKDVFARLQETQRLQRDLHDFPEFDLGFLGTAALHIVYTMPDADQLILKQVCLDFTKKLRNSNAEMS